MSGPQFDVLIVGAGASGAVAANRLVAGGLSVVCLEQGSWPDRASFRGGERIGELVAMKQWSTSPGVRRLPADYEIDVSESDRDVVNFNGVGGGTVLYNAQWPRLHPGDFCVRSTDGVAADWPVGYDELQPFYERTDREFGAAGLGGNPAYPPGEDPPLPPLPVGRGGMKVARAHHRLGWHWWPETNAILSGEYLGRHACIQRGTCAEGCAEGAKASTDLTHWPAAVAEGAVLITGAAAQEVLVGPDGRASGVRWRDGSGEAHVTTASAVLLAANAIGTARLLLNSRSSSVAGLANSSGLVGRGLMLHPLALVHGVFEEDFEGWRGQRGGLIQSTEFYASDPTRGFIRGARWSLSPGAAPLRTALFQARNWGAGHHRAMRERFGRSLSWTVIAEDLPEDSNRIELSPDRVDRFGMPIPKIMYRLGQNTRRLLEWHCERARESFLEAGAVRTEVVQAKTNGHFMGTARMGDDPATSVTDRWGFCHDVPNLGVVDGSVFVTAGGVNPTSTIVALALRGAEHLLSMLGARTGKTRRRPSPPVVRPQLAEPTPVQLPTTRLTESEREVLGALADRLLPGGDGMPSARAVDVAYDALDEVLAARPDLAAPVRAFLARGAPAIETDPAVLRQLPGDMADLHRAALLAIAGGYYASPAVRSLLGPIDEPPRAVNPRVYPPYLEEGLLDHLVT